MPDAKHFMRGFYRSFVDAWELVRIILSLPFVLITVLAIFTAVASGIIGALVSGRTKQIKDFL